MRIGIDCRVLAGPARTGVYQYIWQLVAAFAELRHDHQFMLYTDAPPPEIPGLTANFSVSVLGRSVPGMWQQITLPLALRRDRVDVFHGPTFTLPLYCPCPSVVTIHDLAFLKVPETVPSSVRRRLATMVPSAIRRARAVVTVSQSVADEVEQNYGPFGERLVSTPLGVSGAFAPIEGAAERVRAELGVQGDFILAVGTQEPRKNHVSAVAAFGAARRRHRFRHKLVLAGPRGPASEAIRSAIAHQGLVEDVVELGFVADRHLPGLYQAASCLFFPSLYEGFGLPVLEAMACGTPVVGADIAAVREVAGDAAMLANPLDTEALADALGVVLTNAHQQEELRKRGLIRSAAFSWRKTAERTLSAYRMAAGRGAL